MKRNDINILVVEDERSFGRVLKEALSKTGMNVVVSASPDDALAKCRVQLMHLMLIDCMLPKMNGIDLSLEVRKTQFDQNPIILMSGIFKELAFENESLSKTGAVAFLRKPFELKHLEELVLKSLEGLLASESWSLKSLLARRLQSVRDRLKIIENLEKISGLDSPMVLTILGDAKVSGHLNIVTQDAQIFGITMCKGLICSFDRDDAEQVTIQYLREKDYLSTQDWEEFAALGEKRALLNKLVNRGYVSPHALEEAKYHQISKALASLIQFEDLQISFVPDASIEIPGGVDFIEAFSSVEAIFNENVRLPYFHSLYQDYWDAPIRLTAPAESHEKVWELDSVKKFPKLKQQVIDGNSLSKMLSEAELDEIELFKAVHALVLNRLVLFDDLQKTKNAEANFERAQKLARDLKGLNPAEIFSYFGANAKAPVGEIDRIFKLFSASNHPDFLAQDSSIEHKKVAIEVYQMVEKAFHTLTNVEKREAFFAQITDEELRKRSRADSRAGEGLEQLRRGQYKAAHQTLEEAYQVYPSSRIYTLLVWSEMKMRAGSGSQSRLIEIMHKLDGFAADEKRDPYFWMALGLVKRASGDPLAATFFEKALNLDPRFVEARRELNSIHVQSSEAKSGSKTMDFLKGDITELVSQIFRKKSG